MRTTQVYGIAAGDSLENDGVKRTLVFGQVQVTLLAIPCRTGWRARVVGAPACQALDFYGEEPKEALDHAEAFARRLLG